MIIDITIILHITNVDLVIRYCSGKKNAGADALSRLPVDQDDNGDSSLSKKQDDDNDIFVAATVIEDNAKSGERDSKGNNENESSSSYCQQEQGVSSVIMWTLGTVNRRVLN